MSDKTLSYEIIEHIGIISERKNYQKEVNIIAWSGRKPAYDIRNFRVLKDGTKTPMRGIALDREDMVALKDLLSGLNL